MASMVSMGMAGDAKRTRALSSRPWALGLGSKWYDTRKTAVLRVPTRGWAEVEVKVKVKVKVQGRRAAATLHIAIFCISLVSADHRTYRTSEVIGPVCLPSSAARTVGILDD